MASKLLLDELEAEEVVLRPRYYQLEMLEESKKVRQIYLQPLWSYYLLNKCRGTSSLL